MTQNTAPVFPGWPYCAFPDRRGLGPLELRMSIAEQQLAQAFGDHDWDEALRLAGLLFPDVPAQDVSELWEVGREREDAELVGDVQRADWVADDYVHRLRSLVEKVQAAETGRGRVLSLVPPCEADAAVVA